MIWHGGEILPDDSLRISSLDRSFEHGLGLFETFRTWRGRVRSLPRHLERLTTSARALRISLDPVDLPTEADLERLLAAEGSADAVVRITLSGGLDASTGAVLWARARPLPGPIAHAWSIRTTWRIGEPNPLLAHKTLNYWRNRSLHEAALRDGFDEDLGRDAPGRFLEGTRSNLFIVLGDELLTTAAEGLILPGIMRSIVLERAAGSGVRVIPHPLGIPPELVRSADEVFLTNSVRGIVPVGRISTEEWEWVAREDGSTTERLGATVLEWLRSEERP